MPLTLPDGDFDRANRQPPSIAEFDDPISLFPLASALPDASLATSLASDLRAWRAADATLDQLLSQGIRPHAALRLTGLRAWQTEDYARAAQMFVAALQFDGDSAETWADLSTVSQAAGDIATGRLALERALALDPDNGANWLKLALQLKAVGETDRAETAFQMSIACSAPVADARAGLGMLQFESRRYIEAAVQFKRAVMAGSLDPHINACLGQALFLAGDFAGAAEAFRQQLKAGEISDKFRQRFGLACFLDAAVGGDVDSAMDAYRRAAGPHAENIDAVMESAFHLLSGYGHLEAAVRIGKACRFDEAEDPVHAYLLAAVQGAPLDRAPSDYIVRHFDRFAGMFDTQLVDVLDYRVPAKLATLVAPHCKAPVAAADLGCGTGLAGAEFRPLASRLIGVDLSAGMLKIARAKGIYDQLHQAEIDQFLRTSTERFELVILADALVYRGELGDFFALAGKFVSLGGILAFNIETTSNCDYRILPSGRFAHNPSRVLAWAEPWFSKLDRLDTTIRLEANQPVAGSLLVLQRRK